MTLSFVPSVALGQSTRSPQAPARSGAEAAASPSVGSGAKRVASGSAATNGESKVVGSARRKPAAEQPMFGTFEGTYALGGLSTGMTFAPSGYYLGGELSLVRQFREFAWLGGYVDGVYDFGIDQTRLSIGPEVGWSALGLDVGYLLALDAEGQHSGLTARPLVTIGYVAGFARVTHVFDQSKTWLEAGVLLKYPLEL